VALKRNNKSSPPNIVQRKKLNFKTDNIPLSESQRNQIANYKIQIESVRKALNTIKENKKQKSEYYANAIKGSKDANYKRTLRQRKIYEMNGFASQIESRKKDIERLKAYIQSIKR
jgi:hypothetical protein